MAGPPPLRRGRAVQGQRGADRLGRDAGALDAVEQEGDHVLLGQEFQVGRGAEEILGDFSVNDATHMLHYLLKMLEGMQRLDQQWIGAMDDEAAGL